MQIRKLIQEVLQDLFFETFGPAKVSYTAVVIEDAQEYLKLKAVADEYVPKKGWRRPYLFHMTVCMGHIPETLELRGDLNKEIELTATAIGISDKAVALEVGGYYTRKDIPHITLGFEAQSRPADSGDIREWKPIAPFKIKGVLREVGLDGKVLLPEQQV